MANCKSPEEITEIRRLLSEGLSARAVARKLGIKENTVLRYHPKNSEAIASDAKRPKKRGPYKKRDRPPKARSTYFLSRDQIERIEQMSADGASVGSICEAVGCSESSVTRYRRRGR